MNNFSLYYPVKPKNVLQAFGVNPVYYAKFKINGHNGLDLEAFHGQPVYAAHDGMAWYEVDSNSGHGVILVTQGQFDYMTLAGVQTKAYYKSIYWHLVDSSIQPQFKSPVESYTDTTRPGLVMKAGDLIGYADNSGAPNESTGDHLHFGLKPQILRYPGDQTNIEQNDGYLGAIDPTPYFNGLYAQDINTSKPTHTFYIPMNFGDTGSEVLALQRCLQWAGYFPVTQECTGFYGSITAGAVFAFQKDHVITGPISGATVWFYMGRKVGTFTIPALNKMFAS